ncbi:hypothetical protein EYF80_063850 [Liparis tanakae]|uniref:Uncharacterized protein n=1 Tax=Liparis tanakae TaxID=230148 RepID=A0A4Z2EBU0_9TELE|nr:hypothetical protein EYF80_063850 [Liparis tanakae]
MLCVCLVVRSKRQKEENMKAAGGRSVTRKKNKKISLRAEKIPPWSSGPAARRSVSCSSVSCSSVSCSSVSCSSLRGSAAARPA